jgi:CyaY protein
MTEQKTNDKTRAMMDDKAYRHLVDEAFKRIDAAYEPVDPDLAESMYAQGTLTVVMAGRRLIVSPQPPVRQIWVAFKDRAWHFDRDEATGRWLDDRGQGVELFALVEELTREAAGVTISIAR